MRVGGVGVGVGALTRPKLPMPAAKSSARVTVVGVGGDVGVTVGMVGCVGGMNNGALGVVAVGAVEVEQWRQMFLEPEPSSPPVPHQA